MCREGTTTKTQTTSERKSLKVVALPYFAYGALYIAKDKGYFEDENLDVELVPMFASEPALPGRARGSSTRRAPP
jgi:ABC-type nitrate/sulfonate/bicarbonate transport system substrate-binding protein